MMFKQWSDSKYIQHLSLTARKIVFNKDPKAAPWINKIVACQRTISERIGHQASALNELRREQEISSANLSEAESFSLRNQISIMERNKARFTMYKMLFHYLKLCVEVEDLTWRIAESKQPQQMRGGAAAINVNSVCDMMEQKLDAVRACRNDFADFMKFAREYDEELLLQEVIEKCRSMIDEIRNKLKHTRQPHN